MPSAPSTTDLWCLGGAVSDVPHDVIAFQHRDEPYRITFEANWEDPADDANVGWAREGFAEVEALPLPIDRYGNFSAWRTSRGSEVNGNEVAGESGVGPPGGPTGACRPDLCCRQARKALSGTS